MSRWKPPSRPKPRRFEVADGQGDLLVSDDTIAEREQDAAKVERDTGNEGLAQSIRKTDDLWSQTAMAAVEQIAKTGQEFTAFDLTQEPYSVPEPDHPNRWGGLLARMKARGVIEHAGFTTSDRPATAGSAVRTWHGVRREAT